MQKHLIVFILLLSLISAFGLHLMIRRCINPRSSPLSFLLYLILHLLSVLFSVWLFGMIVFRMAVRG